jgi:putative inorganic carbon (hco3(-)) transporter
MSFISFLLYLIATFLRPQEWVPFFYGSRLVLILSIATLIFLIFERMSKKEEGLVRVPQNFLILGLFFAVIMSHMAHAYFGGMVEAIGAFYINVILCFLILNVLNTKRKFKIAIWFVIGLITLMAIQGIYQFNHGYGWAGQELIRSGDTETGRINWVGIFNDPNDLALTFVIGAGIVLAFLFGKSKILTKVICAVLLGAFWYGIFLTNSRGGMLALVVIVFFYFVRRSRKFLLGGIIGVLFIVAIFSFSPSRIALLSTAEESAYNRVELWYGGLQMLKSNPLFGVGYGMFQNDLPQTAHNSYVLAAAELGFIGFFFFMGLIYVSFKELSIIQKFDEKLKKYALGLQSGLIGFCAAAFFLSRTYIILPYILFAFTGALLHVSQQKNQKFIFHLSNKDWCNIGFLSVGILLLIFIIIKVGLR